MTEQPRHKRRRHGPPPAEPGVRRGLVPCENPACETLVDLEAVGRLCGSCHRAQRERDARQRRAR